MDAIKLQQIVALLGVLLAGIIFLLAAYKSCKQNCTSLDGFLLANQQVSGQQFANTFAVAGVALAGNIAFFIESHREYGYLMGLGPLFYTLAQLVFLYLFHNKRQVDYLKIRTLADLWAAAFPGKIIARFLAILFACNCVMVVFAEILAGTEMIAIFLPPHPIYKGLVFFLLGLIVLAYVCYGGYKAVIKTDGWQLSVLLLMTAVMIFFVCKAPILNQTNNTLILQHLFDHSANGSSLWFFLLWAIWLNIALAATDIALWHRMAAATSSKAALVGFIRGLWKWLAIFMLPMMCFVVLYLKGNHYNNLGEFFTVVQSQSGVLGYVILPVITVGFASALFSTADTYMIAGMFAICDNHTFLPMLEKIPSAHRETAIKKFLAIFMVLLSFSLAILYYIKNSSIGQVITPIMYAIWGQICITAPLIMYATYRYINNKPIYYLKTWQNYLLIISWLLGMAVTIYTALLGNNLYAQLSLLFGTAFVVVAMIICFSLGESAATAVIKN